MKCALARSAASAQWSADFVKTLPNSGSPSAPTTTITVGRLLAGCSRATFGREVTTVKPAMNQPRFISGQPLPSPQSPLLGKAHDRHQKYPRLVPQRLDKRFGNLCLACGQARDEFVEVFRLHDFAASAAGDAFEQGGVGLERPEFLGGWVGGP